MSIYEIRNERETNRSTFVKFNLEKLEARIGEESKFNRIQDQKFNEREESKSSYLFMKLETREDIAGNVTFNLEKFELRTSEESKFNGIRDQKFNEREESKSSYLFMKS